MLLALVAAWVIVLASIRLLGNLVEDQDRPAEVSGVLDERFQPSLVTEWQGKNYAYRDHELENVLVIGVDTKELSSGEAGYRNGGQADFLLLLVRDKTANTLSALQLDRDTITPVRMYTVLGREAGVRNVQLCLAQAFGKTTADGCENTIWAVSNLLGSIPIDHYIAMTMEGISAFNDAIGGVTVTIDEDLTAADPAFVKGETLTLTGAQAEHFVRARRTVSDGTNVSRMSRQRIYISAALAQVKQKVSENKTFAEDVFNSLRGYITSDMGSGALVNTVYACSQCDWRGIQNTSGVHTVGENEKMQFFLDEDALDAQLISLLYTPWKN